MSKAVSFDTETLGFAWWSPEGRAFMVQWATEEGEWWAVVGDDPDPARLTPEIAAKLSTIEQFKADVLAADTIIAHNAKFDIHQARESLGFDICTLGKELHDTELESRVFFPEGQNKGSRGGHGLKNNATVHLRVDAKDPEEAIKELGKRIGLRTIRRTGAYYEVFRAYPNEMATYGLSDVRYTYDLHPVFQRKAADEPAQARIYEMERRVLPILIEAERVGMRTDQAKVQQFKAEFTADRDAHREALVDALGIKALTPKKDWEDEWADGEDPDSLVDALLELGVPLHERTDGGKLSTSKFALQEFEPDFPVISTLFEHRRLERFLNTYIGPMDGVDVIHPNFGQIGAWTGRMACRQPNMQNWPKRAGKQVRSVLIPREGHCFVVYDYEGIEARLLAYYLGDPWYRELVATRDPHAWMCTQIWGGEVEDYIKGSPKEISHRQPAKNILFAITYGAGRKRVSAMLRDAGMPSSEADAKKFIGAIKSSLPNYWHLTKDRIEPKIKQLGYVNTVAGRKNPVKRDKAYVGLNALIQGSAADIFKLGLIAVNDAVRPLGATPLLFVHDEIVVECPLGRAQECGALMEAAMCGAWDLNPPLAAEGSVAYNDYSEA